MPTSTFDSARPAPTRRRTSPVRPARLLAGGVLAVAAVFAAPEARAAGPAHAIAMHGEPLYPDGFTHFRYADPAAPKGGRITWGAFGSFDSLNPFIVKGQPARGLRDGGQENYVYESLMVRGQDEAFTLYCLICATVEVPDDRSWVEFKLRPEARFSDGEPVEAEDIAHSFELLRDEGRPPYTIPYKRIARVETPDAQTVRFVFGGEPDKELPLIMGLMPILPKHLVSREDFVRTSLAPPVGSGPYRVAQVDPGKLLVLRRNPEYWGRGLAVKRGFDNFDEIRFEYYRTHTSIFESFKAGRIDVYNEGDPNRWQTSYDFPALNDGLVVKESFETILPRSMYGFVFNTRRSIFEDVRVRETLASLLDFEWINKNLYFGLYKRTGSYFHGSELSALGRPADAAERKLLEPYLHSIPTELLEGTWRPPAMDGSGRDRAALKVAIDKLAAAGWTLAGGTMRHAASGRVLAFELIVQTQEQERIALVYQRTLKQIGIEVSVRTLDSAQNQRRRTTFDFDMMPWTWGASLSPGNEQWQRWSVATADVEGSFNLPGARQPGHDALIGAMLAAGSRETFVSAVRAFDRLLISGFYVVPLYHQPQVWLARWTRIERPSVQSATGPVTAAWWAKPGGSQP